MLIELKVADFSCHVENPDSVKNFDEVFNSKDETAAWGLEMLTLLMMSMAPEKRNEFLDLSVEQKLELLRMWCLNV